MLKIKTYTGKKGTVKISTNYEGDEHNIISEYMNTAQYLIDEVVSRAAGDKSASDYDDEYNKALGYFLEKMCDKLRKKPTEICSESSSAVVN